MSANYLLALDAGTGSVRAVLFDLEGVQIACAAREWEHKEDPRFSGSMDFDWTAGWALTADCIKEVLAQSKIAPEEIAAISTTCMREGIVLYDEEGKELWACANVDARSTDEVSALIAADPELERTLYASSGQTFALGALPRLLWVKNKLPELYSRVFRIGMFNDWLIYRLTGTLAVEPSNGSTTGLFDLGSRQWDPDIAKRCGLRDDIFPPVLECGEKVSAVSRAAAAECGLSAGTPVVVGGGDAQLGCIGVGVVAANQAAVFGGSFWQYEYNTDFPTTDPHCRVRVNCHGVPGIWQYEALAFKPGLVMRWFRDGFCQLEQQEALASGRDVYAIMDEKAATVPPGCYGMLAAFSDVMNFIQWKHAAPTFTDFALDPARFSRYTFYRSILENTALVLKGHVELVETTTGNRPREIVFAAGASKSPLWCQIVADVLGLPVKVPVVREATALGAAVLAGVGVGIYKTTGEGARRVVRWAAEYLPNDENHRMYDELYQRWRAVYAAQLSLCDRGLTTNLWIAPGCK